MPKKIDQRYIASEGKFLEYSFYALKDRFKSMKEFVAFYEKISSDVSKNLFLKTASFYLFLVKNGYWCVDIPESSKKIDYLDDTYKYIAIFSLIESIQENEYIDFYSYLIRRKTNVKFPISDKKKLEQLYSDYKQEFGSVQMANNFFNSLSKRSKDDLIQNLEVRDATPSIDNLSKYLYNLRSKFVHEAQLIANMSGKTTVSKYRNKNAICRLSINKLMEFFEEGLIIHFSGISDTKP